MGKASTRKKENDTVHRTGTGPDTTQSRIEEPLFAGGELGQLQEILFGQQQRSTNQQIGLLQEQLNEQLHAISVELHARVDQLAESLETSRVHFDQQLDSLKSKNQSGLVAANESISSTKADIQKDIAALSKSNSEGAERMSAELIKYESNLLAELNRTKLYLQTEMKDSMSSLNNSKLDRENLAQLLSDISGKLSDSDNVGSN